MKVVFIPFEDSRPLEPLVLENKTEIAKRIIFGVDKHDVELLLDDEQIQNVISTLLVRSEGLYAHHNPTDCSSRCEPNVRATRLAMACGLFSMRLRGNVIVSRSGRTLDVEDISAAACGSYDLRRTILEELLLGKDDYYFPTALPLWMANASRENYHDAAVLRRLATVMTNASNTTCSNQPDDDEDYESSSSGCDVENEKNSWNSPSGGGNKGQETTAFAITIQQAPSTRRTFVTTVPLCLECRRPASELCPNCEGAYFCDAQCRAQG